MADKITVLLVDDHALVRKGFRRMLEDDPTITVVGEANDGNDAVKLALQLKPRVTVMDCALPGISGIEASRQIRAKWADAAILMLSMHSEDTLIRQALEGGARGYILKNAMDLDLLKAVRSVAEGKTVIDPSLVKPEALKGERESGLTARELEVLQHIAKGLRNKEIGAALKIAEDTVKIHVKNIFIKLSVIDRTQAVVIASQRGIISLDRRA